MAVEVGKRKQGGLNIPFGAKIISGTARAINGVEARQGIVNLLERTERELGLDKGSLVGLFESKERQWPELGKLNVAFPMLQVAVWGFVYENGETGAHVFMKTNSQLHKEMVVGKENLEWIIKKEFKVEVGPEAVPDNLREKLGLTVLIEIETQDGKREMIEAPMLAAPTTPEPKKVDVQQVIEKALKPETPGREMTEAELVADLPTVEVERKETPKTGGVQVRRPKIEIGRGAK